MDEMNKKIIEILKKDARTPLSHISEEIGLSSPSIKDRLTKMEQEGIILGYRPLLNYARLGLPLTAFINLKLHYPLCCTNEFIEKIHLIDEVIEGHYTDGEEDMLLKVVAREPSHLQEILLRINSLPGVAGSNSIISLTNPIRER
ncbi:MAG: Lrp/AsnC family transcriptional regulator [Candidatus Bathyarchaeota archaeon]|nr:Lrp/AsnC family transcriptional regulator [Candidatus Bathyarchaeota archaeon]